MSVSIQDVAVKEYTTEEALEYVERKLAEYSGKGDEYLVRWRETDWEDIYRELGTFFSNNQDIGDLGDLLEEAAESEDVQIGDLHTPKGDYSFFPTSTS